MNIMTTPRTKAVSFNKPAYIISTTAAVLFLILKNYDSAATFAGIALIFDPFNVEQPFDKRPSYQKIWLVGQLVLTAVCFGLMIFL